MAYQPFPRPILGHLSVVDTGAGTPVELEDPGNRYVLSTVKIIDEDAGPLAVLTEAVSLLTVEDQAVEFMFVANPDSVDGDPLVYAQIDPLSRLEVAYGNGTQTITGGIDLAGRYVPGLSERGLPVPEEPSDQFIQPIPPGFVAFLVAEVVDDGPPSPSSAVCQRTRLREVDVDENGIPISRGVPAGM